MNEPASMDTGTINPTLEVAVDGAAGDRDLALDGLRGVAILGTVACHFSERIALPLTNWFTAIVDMGGYGVDLFFVLSGFLITRILLRTRDNPRFLSTFFARRFLRIMPLYYAVLIVVFGLAAMGVTSVQRAVDGADQRQLWWWLYAVNLLDSFTGTWHGGILAHFWTLSIEEQFYLVWPFIVALGGRRAIIITSCILVVLAPALRCIAYSNNWITTALLFTFCRIDGLAAGSLVACVLLDKPYAPSARRIARLMFWGSAVAMAYLAWAYGPSLSQLEPSFGTAIISAFVVMFASVVITSVVAPRSLLGRVLSLRFLRVLGKYSYGMYVFHLIIRPEVDRWLPLFVVREHVPLAPIAIMVRIAVGLVGSFACAYLAYHLLEKHFLRLKRFFPSTGV